jgi:hypothetical protein
MKIAMDSRLIPLYQKMLSPYRQIKPSTNLRYSPEDKEDFDIIDALDKISKIDPPPRFCKLPSNEAALKENPTADEKLPECCRRGIDIHKINNINRRTDALQDSFEDLEYCKLLAEAEECKVNVLLTRKDEFIKKLSGEARGVRITKPADYFKE